MKVAVCFSGQLRTWKKVYKTWEHIINNNDTKHEIDYFFHAFKENSIPKIGVSHVDMELLDTPQVEFEELKNIFNPKKYEIESQKKFIENLESVDYVNPYICQYYSMFKSSQLKKEYERENNFEYDLVIKMRYDLFFNEDIIDTNKIFNENIYYGYNPSYDEYGNLNRITDLFFYSKSKTFDFLSEYYNNIKCLPSKYKDYSLEPEFAWFYYVTSNNITIDEYHWDIKVMRKDMTEVKNKDLSYETY